MSKRPTRKNKRSLFIICLAIFFILASLAVYILYPYINVRLITNFFPGLSSTVASKQTIYGENIDMSQILPASQYYVVNSKGQDLIDIAASLGINFIRITNGHRSFNNDADSIYTKQQWDQVLDKMQSKGIKADILIEVASDNTDYYNPQIQPVYLHLVQKYIDSGVFSHPDVYDVDIKNEPILTDANLRMLQTAHAMIKKAYPHLKQTIGAWGTLMSPQGPYEQNNYNWTDFAAGQKISGLVDFYSVHLYGLDSANFGIGLNARLRTKLFLTEVEDGLQTQKPILIEEFGEANGDAVSDQDTIGTPQLQANIYQGMYQALKELHSSQLMGAVAFDFYSRNQYPDAWAIVKSHGDYLLPAAYILQEYALGKNNPSLKALTVVNSQSYLVKNANNYTTKTMHVHDRIGLRLQLDTNQNYSISLSGDGTLQSVESFHYESVFDSYLAVYQATGQGTVKVNVKRLSNDINSDNQTVYKLTVNIQ
jgi:hypothetical protein